MRRPPPENERLVGRCPPMSAGVAICPPAYCSATRRSTTRMRRLACAESAPRAADRRAAVLVQQTRAFQNRFIAIAVWSDGRMSWPTPQSKIRHHVTNGRSRHWQWLVDESEQVSPVVAHSLKDFPLPPIIRISPEQRSGVDIVGRPELIWTLERHDGARLLCFFAATSDGWLRVWVLAADTTEMHGELFHLPADAMQWALALEAKYVQEGWTPAASR